MPWRPLPLSYAVAIYPFQPSTSTADLPLQIGDQLYVIEQGGKGGAWCRGYLVAPPSLLSALSPEGRAAADARVFSGVFPRCCIEIREELGNVAAHHATVRPDGNSKPPAPVPMLKIGDESPTSANEPLVDEISSCLREWYILHLPDLVLRREYDLLEHMSTIITRLEYSRRQLLNDVLTLQERMGVRDQAVWDLARGNKMLDGEVIVRDSKQLGRLLTSHDSAVEISKLQTIMGALDSPPLEKVETTTLHHGLLEIKSVTGSDLDTVMLNLSLYEKSPEGVFTPFSEIFSTAASAKIRTVFGDLNARDIASDDHLYLVAKVIGSELPRVQANPSAERPPSRSGTLRASKDSMLARRRSTLMFGSKRKAAADRPQLNQHGRFSSQTSGVSGRSSTPTLPEEPDDEKASKPVGPPVPRVLGVGLVDVARLFRNHQEEQSVAVTIWSASPRSEEKMNDWDPLVPWFLKAASLKGYAICNRVSRIEIGMKAYEAPDSESLIRNNPTSMYLVGRSQKMGFSEAPSKPRSDIYLTLSKPVIPQGAQLSHPESGLTTVKASTLLNVQLTMEVRDAAGRRVDHCIHVSSNSSGVTAFRTNAVELGSAWDQTVCLKIPSHRVAECHLVLSIADAPEFPFALGWMPLWDKQAFVSDGRHSLILHAYDKSTSSIIQGRGAYLSLPWDNETFSTGHDGVRASLATLEIFTKLCSTEYSQDRLLVSLIYWKHQSSIALMDLLQKLIFVPEIEIVKQLSDVLDALFAVLVHKSGESKFEDLIFNDIVFVLGIIHDRRFNLGPLIEQYAENHFNSPYAASCLVRSFTRLLQSVSDPQSARDMRALFRVGRQFIKLLITSYQQRRTSGQSKDMDKKHLSFKEDMQAVLFGLQMMMRSETAALVGSKTLLVQNFHTWIPELLSAYTKDEVINVAIDFADAGEDATGKLALYRLVMILNYTKVEGLWIDPKDRSVLVKHCIRWLLPHWTVNNLTEEWREQVSLCCSIVAELTKHPTSQLHDFMPHVVGTYCYIASAPAVKHRTLKLLFPAAYPFEYKTPDSNDPFDGILIELSALASTIAKIRTTRLPRLHEGQNLSDYILSTLFVLRSLLNNEAYPSTWLSLHIYHHSSALAILRYLDGLLSSSYLPDAEDAANVDMQLWKAYLETLLALVASPSLRLETFPEQKRRAVWKISGDIRQAGADLLRHSWETLGWDTTEDDLRRYNIRKLGGLQVQYVPSLVGPVVELCLSMHEGVRSVAVQVLQTMIVSEWALSEDLELIENEIIGSLNTLLNAQKLNANEAMARKLWVGELLDLFSTIANQPEDALWTALEELAATVDELVDLLTVTEGEGNLLQNNIDGEMEKARQSVDGVGSGRDLKEYGVHALECYKRLAAEYERNGDYTRLAKTYHAIARIHEARAASRLGSSGVNGHVEGGDFGSAHEDDE